MKMSLASILVGMAAALLAAPACGEVDDPSDECVNLAGTWDTSGECGPDVCVVTQSVCSTAIDCGGSSSYSGAVTGNSVTYQGQTTDGTPGSCTGTLSG